MLRVGVTVLWDEKEFRKRIDDAKRAEMEKIICCWNLIRVPAFLAVYERKINFDLTASSLRIIYLQMLITEDLIPLKWSIVPLSWERYSILLEESYNGIILYNKLL